MEDDDKHVATVTVVTDSKEEAWAVAEAIRILLYNRRLGCAVTVGPKSEVGVKGQV